jgi:hypothetical protein
MTRVSKSFRISNIEGGARYLGLKMTAGMLAFPEVTWNPGHLDSHRSSAAKATIEWKPAKPVRFQQTLNGPIVAVGIPF